AGQIAVVALVQRLVLDDRDIGLPHLRKQEVERVLRTLERRGESDIEGKSLRLQLAAGLLRFGDALRREIDVAPAREQVLQIPFALAVTHEHEKTVGHSFLSLLFGLTSPAVAARSS